MWQNNFIPMLLRIRMDSVSLETEKQKDLQLRSSPAYLASAEQYKNWDKQAADLEAKLVSMIRSLNTSEQVPSPEKILAFLDVPSFLAKRNDINEPCGSTPCATHPGQDRWTNRILSATHVPGTRRLCARGCGSFCCRQHSSKMVRELVCTRQGLLPDGPETESPGCT